MFMKYGASAIYVLSGLNSYAAASGTGTAFHISLPVNTLPYCSRNISGCRLARMQSRTSAWVGQTSRRYTGSPSFPVPSGSCVRSMSTVPASAYATTSGGLAR